MPEAEFQCVKAAAREARENTPPEPADGTKRRTGELPTGRLHLVRIAMSKAKYSYADRRRETSE